MYHSGGIIKSVLILLSLCLIIPATAVFGGDREDTWDFYIPISYIDSTNISGQNGSNVDINKDFGLGFGFGYNFTDNFQLGGLFTFNSSTYDATVVLDDGSEDRYSSILDSSTISMNGIYYFLKGDLTPFVSGSIGYTFIDTNIPIGPPQDVCWWDPWYGRWCDYYVPTLTDNNLSYGAGVGMQYDLNDNFGLRLSYNKTWYEISSASDKADYDIFRFSFIFRLE